MCGIYKMLFELKYVVILHGSYPLDKGAPQAWDKMGVQKVYWEFSEFQHGEGQVASEQDISKSSATVTD
jgi:hypothetical protein